ncbi:MAG: transcriptional regulator NrdR [Candidatus Neomarinimicrobiota bacterium]|nr:transcriptional regulator NrdR [Candidatus Neomarinimicrobiota bacterium]|tara:strand:+ start:676 stop:1125 length:450 start_codon:yes stop_codon:yes gene_type:complete
MKCLNCDNEDSKVVDSRSVQQGASIRRRRECNKCSFRYTTYEYILTNPVMVVKKTGVREEYDRNKIEKSFHIACKKRPVSEKIIQNAIQDVEEKISNISNIEIEAHQIGELVMETLKNIDKVAFIRFASVYREFKDIGEFQIQIEDLNG